MSDQRICRTCEWFKPDFEEDRRDGFCVFNPPVTFLSDGETFSAQPEVNETDRCGCHQPKA